MFLVVTQLQHIFLRMNYILNFKLEHKYICKPLLQLFFPNAKCCEGNHISEKLCKQQTISEAPSGDQGKVTVSTEF